MISLLLCRTSRPGARSAWFIGVSKPYATSPLYAASFEIHTIEEEGAPLLLSKEKCQVAVATCSPPHHKLCNCFCEPVAYNFHTTPVPKLKICTQVRKTTTTIALLLSLLSPSPEVTESSLRTPKFWGPKTKKKQGRFCAGACFVHSVLLDQSSSNQGVSQQNAAKTLVQ